MDVMLDLETLSTRTTATVIQIGAVAFEPISRGKIYQSQAFNRFVLPQDGFAVDASTLAFWLQQQGAKYMGVSLESQGIPLATALDEFRIWPSVFGDADRDFTWADFGNVWCTAPILDFAALQHAYEVHGVDAPWTHRQLTCGRTLFHIVGEKPSIDWTGAKAHDALDDAIGQAQQVQIALGMLGK